MKIRVVKKTKPKRGPGSGNHRIQDLRGNSTDRKARKKALLQMNPFCWKCGKRLSFGTAHQDRFIGSKKGGKYTLGNVRLACAKCNLSRGGGVQKARASRARKR